MNYNYKYRLYPTEQQKQRLENTLDTCRHLYNYYLEQLNNLEETPSRYQLQNKLPKLKKEWSELKDVHSKVLQMVVKRLYDNLKSLTKKKEKGYNVGKLRYKSEGWYKTFTYNQSGYKLKENNNWLDKLYLSKIGEVPIQLHREIPSNAEIKQVKIKRSSCNEWYAVFGIETHKEQASKPKLDEIDIHKDCVGIDLGITKYVHDSDGNKVGLLDITEETERLEKEQRNLSRKEHGSNNYEQQRRKVAEIHEKIQRKRRDFLHKLSRWYVENYDVICVEDLDVKDLMESSSNSRNKANASWNIFIEMLEYKAESAGTHLIKVDPRGTTKECSRCGVETDKPIWIREHSCPSCGFTADRDENASYNILNRGLQELGLGCAEVTPSETGASTETTVVSASSVIEQGSPTLKETALAVE